MKIIQTEIFEESLFCLLAGGIKDSQNRDIAKAAEILKRL